LKIRVWAIDNEYGKEFPKGLASVKKTNRCLKLADKKLESDHTLMVRPVIRLFWCQTAGQTWKSIAPPEISQR